MKKTYIVPELQIVKIQTASILAGSDPDTVEGSINGGEINTGWTESRRGGDFYDDDE